MSDPNIAMAGPDWPSAVVACGHQTGVVLARNLERRGVRVTIVDYNPQATAWKSVYGQHRRCPNPDSAPEEWLAFMLGLSEELGGSKPALLCGSDQFVSAVGRFSDELGQKFCISPSAKMQADLALKEGQIRISTQFGLPIPRTLSTSTLAGVESFADVCSFPCLFKPQQHRYWELAPAGHPLFLKKVMISENRAELLKNYAIASEFSPEVTLQEIIEGPDSNKRVHVAVYGRDGNRIGCATTRAFRTLPKMYGVGSMSEPCPDKEVEEVCDRFFRAAGYHGICEIELKWDNRDGKVKMMDINPRYSGGGDAMPYAGLDHGWLHYLDLIGKPVQPVVLPPSDFRHVMLVGDMAAIGQYWLSGDITLGEAWRSYRRPVYFYDLDWHDRRVAMGTLIDAAKVVLLTAKRYFVGK